MWAETRRYDVLFPSLRLVSSETSSLHTDICVSLMLFLAKGEVCGNYGNYLITFPFYIIQPWKIQQEVDPAYRSSHSRENKPQLQQWNTEPQEEFLLMAFLT